IAHTFQRSRRRHGSLICGLDARRYPHTQTAHLLTARHFPVALKPSKCVCASDFDHSPTFPASLNVESRTSNCFSPSRKHSMWSPVILTLSACHVPVGTFRPSLVPSEPS